MTKIKIKDLPKDEKISKEELKRIKGGVIGDIGMPNPFGLKVTNRLLLPAVRVKGFDVFLPPDPDN